VSRFTTLLKLLATDRRELQSFLRDAEAWLRPHSHEMTESDVTELKHVAEDLHRLSEYACVADFENTPESRFARHNEIDRRRLMIKGCSVTLAGLFTMFFARFSQAQSQTPGGPPGLAATDAVCPNTGAACSDDGCKNTTCHDTNQCVDNMCENAGTCNDTDCNDNRCTNHDCNDTRCADNIQCTNDSCNDEMCMDIGEPTKCSNDLCGNRGGCIDGGCQNTQSCTDEPGCADGPCQDNPQC
jgi:hypothetical protein